MDTSSTVQDMLALMGKLFAHPKGVHDEIVRGDWIVKVINHDQNGLSFPFQQVYTEIGPAFACFALKCIEHNISRANISGYQFEQHVFAENDGHTVSVMIGLF